MKYYKLLHLHYQIYIIYLFFLFYEKKDYNQIFRCFFERKFHNSKNIHGKN